MQEESCKDPWVLLRVSGTRMCGRCAPGKITLAELGGRGRIGRQEGKKNQQCIVNSHQLSPASCGADLASTADAAQRPVEEKGGGRERRRGGEVLCCCDGISVKQLTRG